MSDIPNILFIMSDEHDAAVTGCYGDPVVQTPNLDRLAADGIRVDNCYCNSPLCVPSRLSFTAGQYISRVGAWSNMCLLPDADMPTLPGALRAAGVEPYLCGKQHYDRTRRYGFTDLLPELGTNNGTKRGHRNNRRPADSRDVDKQIWTKRSGDFHPGYRSNVLDHDRTVTEAACDFLAGRAAHEAPFFLFAGYLAPHFPLIAPSWLHERYRGRVPMPNLPEGLVDNLPRNYRHLREGFGNVEADEDTTRRGRELYWALTDWFDGQIGMLLDTLDATGQADNTLVIYTSDHGENKGDHGLWWKNCCYDHGARVPLIVRWPARWQGGQSRTEVCSLVDVVQTLLSVTGAEPGPDMDGDSLLGVLDGTEENWKDSAVSQYFGHNICSGMSMFRKGNMKYIHHARPDADHDPEVELFDMDADPDEFHNLAGHPAWQDTVNELHAALVAEIGEEPDDTEQRCRQERTGPPFP